MIHVLIILCCLVSNLNGMEQTISRDKQDGWTPLHIAAARNDVATLERLLAQNSRIDGEDKKGRTALFIAAEFGSLDAARLLCERGADLNAKEDEHGLTPLHVASWKGLQNVVALLLDKGAKTDVTDAKSKTALHIAESKEIVKLLLAKKANALLKDSTGSTPADTAAKTGKREVLKALLADVPELTQIGEDGTTLMHRMAQAGANADIIKVARAHGGDIWARDSNGMIPLHRACAMGKTGTVQSLLALDVTQIKAVDKSGRFPIDMAQLGGHTEIVTFLIKSGATPPQPAEKSDDRKKNALTMQSSEVDSQQQLKKTASIPDYLVIKQQRNAQPIQIKNNGKETTLHKAIMKALAETSSGKALQKDIPKAIAEAVKKGTLDALNSKGHSALMLACGAALDCYEGPLERGQFDTMGVRFPNHPLYFATMTCCKANLNLAKELLAAGAAPSTANQNGTTPLLLLVSRPHAYGATLWFSKKNLEGFIETLRFIDTKYPIETPKAEYDDVGTVEFLHARDGAKAGFALLYLRHLENKEELDCVLPDAPTMEAFPTSNYIPGKPFLDFCKKQDQGGKVFKDKPLLYGLIQELIDKGADVNHKDRRGIYILLWALRGGDAQIVKLLLAAGADYMLLSQEQKDNELIGNPYVEIVKILIDMGAQPAATNKIGETALMHAAAYGNEEKCRFLLALNPNLEQTSKSGETALTLACQAVPIKNSILKMLLEAGADKTKVLPKTYQALASDSKFVLDSTTQKQNQRGPNGGDVSHLYDRYDAQEHRQRQQENFERMERGREDQLAAQNRATAVQAAGTAARFISNIAGGGF